MAEGGRAVKALHKVKGFFACVAIQNADGNIFYIECGGKGKNQKLHKGRDNENKAALSIAPNGQNLFFDQR